MPGLNVVAMISGGKDSFYSMLHCIEHGHKIVALANLYPANVEVDDLDSFMYQTIGHAIIPLYEEALGLPLYRLGVDGNAISQSKIYDPDVASGGDVEDETEALLPLLTRVMAAHPEVNAISTGAILSDYQRTRIESIALRLGLAPLAYLWQYPRIVTRSSTSLLEDMRSIQQDSRIIKVSSGGLDSTFLWQNVADAKTTDRLLKASRVFGSSDDGSVLGEGGEYETLTLRGPSSLWKGRLVVNDADCIVVPGEAGSASLQIRNAHVEGAEQAIERPLPIPPLLDERYQALYEAGHSQISSNQSTTAHSTSSTIQHCTIVEVDDKTLFLGSWSAKGRTIEEQTLAIMSSIRAVLTTKGHDMSNIVYTSIVLQDMADFPQVNKAYATAFHRPNPPARATIACQGVLLAGQRLCVSITSVKTTAEQRLGLHVQSISYWAPANIGPYSQAITVPVQDGVQATYIAGQIPLIPATMQLDCIDTSSDGFVHQAVLALQHLHRIATATQVTRWQHAIAFIVAPDGKAAAGRASIARQIWQTVHQAEVLKEDPEQDDLEFDVWHHQKQHAYAPTEDNSSSSNLELLLSSPLPALVVIQVDSLPRSADIEWVAFGLDGVLLHYELPHYRSLLDLFANNIVV